jgi:hypothetical protein
MVATGGRLASWGPAGDPSAPKWSVAATGVPRASHQWSVAATTPWSVAATALWSVAATAQGREATGPGERRRARPE